MFILTFYEFHDILAGAEHIYSGSESGYIYFHPAFSSHRTENCFASDVVNRQV